MIGCLRLLVYGLAAFGLYRLWSLDQKILWWALLVSAILMLWTAGTIKTAVRDLAATDPAVADNPGLAAHRSPDGSTSVVRFWTAVNMAITAVTLILSVWAIVFSFQASVSAAVPARSQKTLPQKLEERYFQTLDGWVARGGPVGDVQRTVVETCGKLVMLNASAGEKAALATTQREEFHFRVDVCTKMTVNRVYPQPEFEKKETVALICDQSNVVLFKKLCRWSKLR